MWTTSMSRLGFLLILVCGNIFDSDAENQKFCEYFNNYKIIFNNILNLYVIYSSLTISNSKFLFAWGESPYSLSIFKSFDFLPSSAASFHGDPFWDEVWIGVAQHRQQDPAGAGSQHTQAGHIGGLLTVSPNSKA